MTCRLRAVSMDETTNNSDGDPASPVATVISELPSALPPPAAHVCVVPPMVTAAGSSKKQRSPAASGTPMFSWTVLLPPSEASSTSPVVWSTEG